jgi:hypothetical protein
MPKVNEKWVKEQFDKANVQLGVGMAVLELLKTWDGLTLTHEESEKALAILSKVAMNYSLVELEPNAVWVAAQPGFIKVGDRVRVSFNAFSGDAGTLHNGREGIIVAIRSGDVIVTTDDDVEPKLEGVHYSPYKLEKRVQ